VEDSGLSAIFTSIGWPGAISKGDLG
jgi:hypothetical protein